MSATSQLKTNSLQIVNAAGEAVYLMVISGQLRVLTPSQAAQFQEISPGIGSSPSSQLTADPNFTDYISPAVVTLLSGSGLNSGANALTLAAALSLTGGSTFSSTSTKGATASLVWSEELLTLSTSGSTTNTSGNLLPANSLILCVSAIVTVTIATATDFALGDTTTAARFAAANSTLTAGTTSVGLAQWFGNVTTTAAGPSQASATTVRVTTSGTPSAGQVRISTVALSFGAPTS